MQHGFADASLRRIAAAAGVTTGALYRHFRDKAALFEAVVSPAYAGFFQMYHAHNQESMRKLFDGGMEPMWAATERSTLRFIEYIYAHMASFTLLLTCSEQTTYAHFVHKLIEEEIVSTVDYMDKARAMGYPARDVPRDELHALVSAQFSCLFELVLHDIPKADALRMVKGMSRFFQAGWRAFFSE